MTDKISALMIVKNAQNTLEKTLDSIKDFVNEIVVVDNKSTDKTLEILHKYSAKILHYDGNNRAKQSAIGLYKAKGSWVLVIDSDEVVPSAVRKEIKNTLKNSQYDGFYIPFQSHYFNKPLNFGGENLKKLIFFKKKLANINPTPLHFFFEVKSKKIGNFQNKINHYSYQSFFQIINKFTNYALYEARLKVERGEKSSLKKIFLYPPHMFWARFIKDKGYKDGLFRIPLDLGFAYMEFLTYFSMLFMKPKK